MRLRIRSILSVVLALAVGLGVMVGLAGPANSASPSSSTVVGASSFRAAAVNYNWVSQGTIRDPGTRFRARVWKSRSYLLGKIQVFRTDNKPMIVQLDVRWERKGRTTIRKTLPAKFGVRSYMRMVELKRGWLTTVRWHAAVDRGQNVAALQYRGSHTF